jgi:hypothetical protein
MTSRSTKKGDRSNGRDAGADTHDPEYRVGPGRPPKEFQFKPGQSGNLQGARLRKPSVGRDLKKLLERALSKKVKLRQGEKEYIVTKAEAGIEQLVNQYAQGDRQARRDLFDFAGRLGVDLAAGQGEVLEKAVEALAPEDEALLADYRARARQASGPDQGDHDADALAAQSETPANTEPGE